MTAGADGAEESDGAEEPDGAESEDDSHEDSGTDDQHECPPDCDTGSGETP